MNQVTTTARGRAVAAQDAGIARNVAQIEAAREAPKPRNALQVLAGRMNLSPGVLEGTLRNTVFKNCSNDEFVALVIVANEYNLNPLTKEIYAFSAKGGGIVPLVSVDGWVRIMNDHPQFDGIEFTDIMDESGKLYAIESVVYRKDRQRPIKVTEYMDECRRETDPWRKTPNRMLRHRALIQGARYAFGFSGIYADDDAEVQMIGEPVDARNVTPPRRDETARPLPAHDADTGEIREEPELSREEQEALDRQGFAQMDGRGDDERGDLFGGDEQEGDVDPARLTANEIIDEINGAANIDALGKIMADNRSMIVKLGEDLGNEIHNANNRRKHELGQARKGAK